MQSVPPTSISDQSSDRVKATPFNRKLNGIISTPHQPLINSLSTSGSSGQSHSSTTAHTSLISLGASSHSYIPSDSITIESATSSLSSSLPTQAPGMITFRRFRSIMLSELAEDAILIANKAYSINLLTRSSLYAIRELPSRDKIPKVLSSIEESIKYDQKFESFVGIIKTITSHADLA